MQKKTSGTFYTVIIHSKMKAQKKLRKVTDFTITDREGGYPAAYSRFETSVIESAKVTALCPGINVTYMVELWEHTTISDSQVNNRLKNRITLKS